jgi:nitroreductase
MNPINAPIPDPDSVDAAIASRRSMRAFLPKPVPRDLMERILRTASHAPSGNNSQPWKVYAVHGARRDELARQVGKAHDALLAQPELASQFRSDKGYNYYPPTWVEPYLGRRRQTGWGMYGVLGITKGDKERMHAQHGENFNLFGAPLGLLFTLDRVMGQGCLLDYGMFWQNIMVSARARGLHTCAQTAWVPFENIVMPLIGANADQEMLVGGMAIGYADPDAPINSYETPREPVESFTRWVE